MSSKGLLLNIRLDAERKAEAFRSLFPDRRIVNYGHEDVDDLAGLTYAVVWSHEHGLLARMPDLEIIFSLGAGVDHVLSDPNLPDVPLVRFVDANLTGRMVEWVTLQVLIHLRRQREYDVLQRRSEWHELDTPAAHEVRVGIMGLGELGTACLEVLKPLGFQLKGWSRSRKTISGVTCFSGDRELDSFLGSTDILVSLLPYTAETHGILNRSLFEKLAKDGALAGPVVINAGRGKSQVEADIVSCLEDGTLTGVSLDVFENEPLAASSPLWGFENAIVTPHMAAVSEANALSNHVANQIRRYEAGEELEHVVEKTRGY